MLHSKYYFGFAVAIAVFPIGFPKVANAQTGYAGPYGGYYVIPGSDQMPPLPSTNDPNGSDPAPRFSSPNNSFSTPSSTTVNLPDFFVGKWYVRQDSTQVSGETVYNYFDNGRFEGIVTQFIGGHTQKTRVTGVWALDKLTDRIFDLRLFFDNKSQWQGRFKIIDQNRIYNIYQNYAATRIN
jgi:hypothetical protein